MSVQISSSCNNGSFNNINNRGSMDMKSTYALPILLLTLSIGQQPPANAQPALTGLTVYEAAPSGTPNWLRFWNTQGRDGIHNVYLFTGSTASPTFLNSGDDNDSLNPNILLSLGTHVFQFAGDVPVSSYLGLNLYFDNDSTNNRITAVVPIDGSTNFSVVPRSVTNTVGLPYNPRPSSGSLSFVRGGFMVTLSEFSVSPPPNLDLVSHFSTSPGDTEDTAGSLTLTVTEAPPALNIEVSEIRVCWNSESNHLYQVQYRSELTTNQWTDLFPTNIAATGTETCIYDDIPRGRPQRFYRVLEAP
jgi:hypothetical protein